MPLEMDRLTREYVWWQIQTDDDMSSAEAEVAFIEGAENRPEEVDWEDTGTDLVQKNGVWWVRRLISGTGQGGDTELGPGDYQTWVRITDEPERPVRRPGVVTIL